MLSSPTIERYPVSTGQQLGQRNDSDRLLRASLPDVLGLSQLALMVGSAGLEPAASCL